MSDTNKLPRFVLLLCCLGALLSGVALFFSVAALRPLFPLPCLILVPLFVALSRVHTWKLRWFLSLLFGVTYHACAMWDGRSYGTVFYIGISIVGALPFILGSLCATFGVHGKPSYPRPLFTAGCWTLLEVVFQHLGLFDCGWIAGTLSLDPFWLQTLDWFGPSLVSFLVVYCNALLVRLPHEFRTHGPLCLRRIASLEGLIIATLIAIVVVQGMSTRHAATGEKVRLSVIQGGLTSEQYDNVQDPAMRKLVLDRYFDLSLQAKNEGARYIIWPETAIRSFVGAKEELQAFMNKLDLPLLGGFPLVVGALQAQFNAVLMLGTDMAIQDSYYKYYILPVTESEFIAGDEIKPVRTPFGFVATPICYEVIFSSLVRTMVQKGAELIVTVSNDSGFGAQSKTSAIVLKQAILRTIENRRYLVRASQSGVSAVVSDEGRLLDRTKLFEQKIFPVEVQRRTALTFYTLHGDWFAVVIMALLIIDVLRTPVRRPIT